MGIERNKKADSEKSSQLWFPQGKQRHTDLVGNFVFTVVLYGSIVRYGFIVVKVIAEFM